MKLSHFGRKYMNYMSEKNIDDDRLRVVRNVDRGLEEG